MIKRTYRKKTQCSYKYLHMFICIMIYVIRLVSIRYLLCVKAAVSHKQLDARRCPGQFSHPRTNLLIQALDSLFKQCSLFGLEAGEYPVVVSDNQHDILSEYPQLFALLVDLGSVVRHLKSEAFPVVHLTKQLQ